MGLMSSNVALLWRKSSDLGTYSGGAWAGSLPLANMVDQDAQRVARSDDATEASTRWRVDLGAAVPRPVNAFALVNHNGTTAATWRVVVTTDASDADAGARVLDTGAMPLWLPTVVLGQQPWGAFPWNGIDATAYPGGTLAFHFVPGAVLARYVWVYVSDTANPAGYFQAGRFIAGVSWSPRINMGYGARIRWPDPSEARRTLGGRRVVTPRPRYRAFEMVFERLSKSEALGTAFEVDRTLGKGGDFILVTEPSEGGEFVFRRAIYASLTDTAAMEEPDFQQWRWSLSAEELI
jgi:hypothetical protein